MAVVIDADVEIERPAAPSVAALVCRRTLIAVVAGRTVDHDAAATRRPRALIAVRARIAVIARLPGGLDGAGTRAAVARRAVPIVAFLAGVERRIAAACDLRDERVDVAAERRLRRAGGWKVRCVSPTT
jgi:hypothetical protein